MRALLALLAAYALCGLAMFLLSGYTLLHAPEVTVRVLAGWCMACGLGIMATGALAFRTVLDDERFQREHTRRRALLRIVR